MVEREDILGVLRTILDPEMPVNLVDLGLIEGVEITTPGDGVATGGAGTVVAGAAVDVQIDALPTFVGCPALDMIRGEIEQRVGALAGVRSVHVRWRMAPPWTTDRITPAGREALRAHGVTTPVGGAGGQRLGPTAALTTLTVSARPGSAMDPTAAGMPVACPFCGSGDTQCESRFGPTRCRMIYYCRACRNSFEHLKQL